MTQSENGRRPDLGAVHGDAGVPGSLIGCLTGSVTTILQLFLGTDGFDFMVPGPSAAIGPRLYHRFSDAQQEVVNVRIYQGIHFRFADEDGRQQGARVGHWVFQKFLKPAHGK